MTALFNRMFDDAALFPPGDAPMADAVPAHRELRVRLGGLVGPFVLPAARLGELLGHLDGGPALEISLIASISELPAAAALVGAAPALVPAAVEVPAVADAPTAAAAARVVDDVLHPQVPVSVELPRTTARDEVLDVLTGTRLRAKLRTGGVRAELFPGPAELAASLHACIARGVPVKCTAGLHSAVRHTDPATGFEHHGFLNVLAAVDALAAGEPVPSAENWLRADDPEALVAAVRGWPAARAARARANFTSFGTCSVTEPVDDLVALGLLPTPEGSPA